MFDRKTDFPPSRAPKLRTRDNTGTAAVALFAACLILGSGLASPRAWSCDIGLSIEAEDRDRLDSCEQVKFRFGGKEGPLETARSDTRILVPRAEAASLRASLQGSGGVRIQPWERNDYEIEVCKAAAADDMEAARKTLGEVDVDREGGKLTARGPEKGQWVVYLILRVPRGGSVEVSTGNGEIDVRGVTGTIDARSQNGPIALRDCVGDVRARAQNGPVATSGGSGKQDLSTQNGPVAVELKGTSWTGAGVTAKTANGPIALSLAPDYKTGVRVESLGRSPIVCSGVACETARRDRREGRRTLAFGEGEPIIRLSTDNGPVAIGSPEEEGVTWG